jgi:hypothetical protein
MKRWPFHFGMGTVLVVLLVSVDRQRSTTSPIPFFLEALVAAAVIAVVIWMWRTRLAVWLRQEPPIALAGVAILIGALAPIITFGMMRTPPQCVSVICPPDAISGSMSDPQEVVLLGGWALSLTLLIWGVIAKVSQRRAPDRTETASF